MLFYKLLKSGIHGRMFKLLQNMYSKIRARVKVNCNLYECIFDECGTNQGGPLSPNMFRYMLKDLKEYLNGEFGIVINEEEILVHILWADDLFLMSDSPRGLQAQLDGLFKFCSKFQMIVNEMKTKIMIFGKKVEQQNFLFNNKSLETVENYKYLGVILNNVADLKGNMFKTMINYIAEKGFKASFATMKKCASVGYLTPKIALHLFDSCVASVLSYASEIWSKDREIPVIEKVHLRFLKYILGVKNSTCTLAIYGELGRFPLHLQQMLATVKYWVRLETMPEDSIVKQTYNMVKGFDNAGYRTWISNVRDIFSMYDLSNCFRENFNIREGELLCMKIKDVMYTRFKDEWYDKVCSYTKMRTFVTFKKEFRFEPYLLLIRDFKLRKVLAKFRLSSHDLEIEKGRYTKKSVNDRICQMCNSGQVEDEQHVIVDCEAYDEFRNTLIANMKIHNLNYNNAEFLVNVLQTNNESLIFSLGKYLQKVF